MAWTVVSNSCSSVYPSSWHSTRLASRKRPSRLASAMPMGAFWNAFLKRCCGARSPDSARLRPVSRLMAPPTQASVM
jgi:hypothetical protein